MPLLGDFLNAMVILEDDGSVTLIDCGLAGSPSRLTRALADLGRHPRDVQRIVLTHAHADHAGGAAAMVQATGVDGVHAHAADHRFLADGVAPPLDASPRMARVLDKVQRGSFAPVPVLAGLADGELLDVAGGMRVVHTPGHTPGHVSLILEKVGVLFTGDCILNPFGRMRWPFRVFCTSRAQDEASAQVLADLDFRLAAFTHGPEVRDRAREAIRSFLTRAGGAR